MIHEFDSIRTVLAEAFAFGTGVSGSIDEIDRKIRGAHHRADYYHGFTAKTLAKAVSNPPAALVGAVDAMRERVAELILPERRARRVCPKSEIGDELSPLAWAMRDPCGWTEIRSIHRPKDALTIGVNLSCGFHRRPEELLYRGAAAAALSDVLEHAGHAVEIIGFSAGRDLTDRSGSILSRLIVKPFDAPLDIGAVSVALCEIGFYRLAFITAEARREPGVIQDGWKCPRSLTASERAGIDILAEFDIRSEADAVAWIRQHAEHASGASTLSTAD